MGTFYSDVIQKSAVFSASERCFDTAMLEPNTRRRVEAILDQAKAQGIECMVWETYRSAQRQEFLFAEGTTKLKRVGVHHFGLAADIVKRVNGAPSWLGDFSFLKKLAYANGLVSGQDWGQPNARHTFIDADHVQAIAVADQDRLFSGAWYPADGYDPYR